MLYSDLKYGLGKEAWDKAPHTAEELDRMLRSFNMQNTADFYTVVLWMSIRQIGMATAALLANGFSNLQDLFWYKVDHNQAMPQHLMLPAVECGIVAYHTNVNTFGNYLDMPRNLHARHNAIIGPGQRIYDHDANRKPVNRCQKPDYLSEFLGSRYMPHGGTVVVCGSGAGGDVRGFMNRGLNIVAIEQEEKQVTAMISSLRAHDRKATSP